jgi:hypothetical protein
VTSSAEINTTPVIFSKFPLFLSHFVEDGCWEYKQTILQLNRLLPAARFDLMMQPTANQQANVLRDKKLKVY